MGNEQGNKRIKQKNPINNFEEKEAPKEPESNPNPQDFVFKDLGTGNGASEGILDKAEDTFSDKKRKKTIDLNVVGGSLAQDIRKFYKFKKEVLGGGQFGSVRVGYKRDNPDKFYAVKSIKTINISKEDMADLIREVEIISSLNHPNIVKFYETYHDEHYFHIVMELCTGNEVFEKIIKDGKITEQIVAKIISKVLHAIAYCHSKGITHRDLKPENILFESKEPDAEIKIIDFGLSKKFSIKEKMHTILGTPFYIAPEVLKGAYDEKCDVWSIGALTYILLSGEPPFNGKNNNDIFEKIINSKLEFPPKKWDKISEDAKSFIQNCMVKEPEKRYSAVEGLKHPWFKNILDQQHNEEYLSTDILNNLKSFSKPEKFKSLVFGFLVNNASQRELMNMKKAFTAIDTNHSGHINASELESAFKNIGIKISNDELNHIIDEAGENTIGKIDYNEFLIACMNQKKNIRKEKLESAFKYFDVDNSGFIDSSDIKNALLRSGQKIVNEDVISKIVEEVCVDKSGKISLDEFLKMFLTEDE